jgi:hypothetical protein
MVDSKHLSIFNVHIKLSGFWSIMDKFLCVIKKQNVLKLVCLTVCLSFQPLVYKYSQGQGSPTT